MTHYYFENCVYFAPQNSHVVLGRYRLKQVTDISTGQIVPHRYNDIPLEAVDAGDGLSWLRPATKRAGSIAVTA